MSRKYSIDRQANSVEFAEDYTPIATKLAKVTPRLPVEITAMQKRFQDIGNALFAWRQKCVDTNPSVLLQIPEGTTFTPEEIDLAGWAREYANQSGQGFRLAVAQIMEYLQPSASANGDKSYLQGLNFSEPTPETLSFNVPPGWSVTLGSLKYMRSIRVYQALMDCNFMEAAVAMEHAVIS